MVKNADIYSFCIIHVSIDIYLLNIPFASRCYCASRYDRAKRNLPQTNLRRWHCSTPASRRRMCAIR